MVGGGADFAGAARATVISAMVIADAAWVGEWPSVRGLPIVDELAHLVQ